MFWYDEAVARSYGPLYTFLGLADGNPGIDPRQYAREDGMAANGLLACCAATDDKTALAAAIRAVEWVLAERSLGDGGFNHAATDIRRPFPVDILAMGLAFLALYRSMGHRKCRGAYWPCGRFHSGRVR